MPPLDPTAPLPSAPVFVPREYSMQEVLSTLKGPRGLPLAMVQSLPQDKQWALVDFLANATAADLAQARQEALEQVRRGPPPPEVVSMWVRCRRHLAALMAPLSVAAAVHPSQFGAMHDVLKPLSLRELEISCLHSQGGRQLRWYLHVTQTLKREFTAADGLLIAHLAESDGDEPAFRDYLRQLAARSSEPPAHIDAILPRHYLSYVELLSSAPEATLEARHIQESQRYATNLARLNRFHLLLGRLRLSFYASVLVVWATFIYGLWQPLPQSVFWVAGLAMLTPLLLQMALQRGYQMFGGFSLDATMDEKEMREALIPMTGAQALALAELMKWFPRVHQWVRYLHQSPQRTLRHGDFIVASLISGEDCTAWLAKDPGISTAKEN